MRGVQIWRSGGVQSPVEEISTPEVICLSYAALSAWHFGEITFCRATMAESISLAKELNDMHALAVALLYAGYLGHFECNPGEVERCASDLIELTNASEFPALAGWRRGFSRLGAERFRGHS